jgi:hypothetical protein
MRRWLFVPALLVAALAFAATGLADPGDGKGKKQGKNRFTFTLTTTDFGSCGTDVWALDKITRTFAVHDNGDGTFRLRRTDKGTFTTTGTQSPGKCETKTKHGTRVRAGVTGKVIGYLEGTVTPAAGQAFNPNATCANPCTRQAFLDAFFGPGATYSCDINSTDCKFNFNYTAAKHQSLRLRHWQDRGKGAGTMLQEVFHGDISEDVVQPSS